MRAQRQAAQAKASSPLGQGTHVEVVLPVPVFHPFTYRVPPGLLAAPTDAAAAEDPPRAPDPIAAPRSAASRAPAESARLESAPPLPTLVPGTVVRVPLGRRTLTGVVLRLVPPSQRRGLRDVHAILPAPYRLGAPALQLAAWIADYYACALGEAVALLLPPMPATAARRSPLLPAQGQAEAGPSLSAAQEQAVHAICASVSAHRYASFLLHGVTGSGKTEVYLRAIEAAMAHGRGAIVLLPEISLTPQTMARIAARFPGRVAPYHSRLSHGERCAVWEAAARGEISVVVGARSAVFVPVRELGLIVVDEEHEGSYKADDRPRAHARDVALMRGSLEGAPVVLGSATPSLESWHNARRGKHQLLSLPQRLVAEAMPCVEVIDRRTGRAGHVGAEGPSGADGSSDASRADGAGNDQDELGLIGPRLGAALEEALARGEQSIVLHNRRGFARYLQCRACGYVLQCAHCDISLTWHLRDDRMHCHYCGYRAARPAACGGCGATPMRPRGVGTQRVEVALQARLPQARILRLDQDTTAGKRGHQRLLDQFAAGEADLLVGTQMVAKGLHFPRVTVVGVVDADAGLHFPDFRAHERAFQLLAQVAGRSGRVGPGRVVLQTWDPDHRVLGYARGHDVIGFLEEELSQRRALGYPPWRRLAAILATAPQEEVLDALLAALGHRLPGVLPPAVQLLGPARAVLARINRRYRGQILLKGNLGTAGKRAVLDLLEQVRERTPGGWRADLALDVDPQQLL
jgi:primosomal protein N' (replication factor Y)